MNDYFLNGLKIGAMSVVFKISTGALEFLGSGMDDGSGASNMSHSLSGILDFICYIPMGIGAIFILMGIFASLGLRFGSNTSSNNNITNNTVNITDTPVSIEVNIPSVQALNDTGYLDNTVDSIVENNEEDKALDVSLMKPEEKIHYYLELISNDIITQKSLSILEKHHLVNEFLENKVVLVGLKEDNDKIMLDYLPKVLENHIKINNSNNISVNIDNNSQHEQKHLNETLYQLDILEKGLDNMIDMNEQNATDEASMMRIFLEKKFSAALPSEFSSVESKEQENKLTLNHH
jgi:hypothetical protein